MAQMPEEGRKFSIVDRYWRDIMTESVSTIVIYNIIFSVIRSKIVMP